MSLAWININPKLENGISLLNLTNSAQFSLILNVLLKTSTTEAQTPSIDDQLMTNLKETLNINNDQIHLMIHTLIHIYKQSMKIIIKPTTLQNNLIQHLKLETTKAQEFVKIWSENTKRDFGNFETHTQLKDVSWELNLQTASNSTNSPTTKLHTTLQLNVEKKSGETENILLDLNKQELIELYATLETIQNRLDHVQTANN